MLEGSRYMKIFSTLRSQRLASESSGREDENEVILRRQELQPACHIVENSIKHRKPLKRPITMSMKANESQ